MNAKHASKPMNLEEKKAIVTVYALLEEHSDVYFVTDSVYNMLEKIVAEGEKTQLKLSTITGKCDFTCEKVNDLIVKGVNGSRK